MKTCTRFSALVLTALLIFAGCGNPQTPSQATGKTFQATETAVPDRHLDLSVVQDDQCHQSFSSEELGGNFSQQMNYNFIKSIEITLDGDPLPLETALAQGNITEDEILYRARQDARAGICETEAKSLRGLTNYYFHYPEYSLLIIQDICEAPDGSQYPISHLTIYSRYAEGSNDVTHYISPRSSFTDPETGYPLDREDWGLTFDVQKVSPTGITMTCTQSGGQQNGALSVGFYLLTDDSYSFLDGADGTYPFEEIPIRLNGNTTFSIDWSEVYGSLSSGNYCLFLNIYDQFDPEQAHPLMVDFHSVQQYPVSFAISE